MADDARYGIAELAKLGGISRRAVRYYVQEQLLPPPLGVGRGRHYGPTHLDQLLRVKALQEEGRSLAEIRVILAGKRDSQKEAALLSAPHRSPWIRLELAPGVELNVAEGVRIPPPAKLLELAEWCRRYFRREEAKDGTAER
ncbi:MAG TPA: MerR family transcriptional regulator [Candidatus Methylomirabilis sp.]|nr:MerR family transcriptional regulator [Candidatus Methylomirabilis sp.]HSC71736.1 MerR family transcriptional regulator [Candidatus Methylomirabilis sp.]